MGSNEQAIPKISFKFESMVYDDGTIGRVSETMQLFDCSAIHDVEVGPV